MDPLTKVMGPSPHPSKLRLEGFFPPVTSESTKSLNPECLWLVEEEAHRGRFPHCYPTVYWLQYNGGLCAPREATVSNCPECLLKTLKRKHLLILYPPPFSLSLNASKANKVDFSNPATQSWIHAFSNPFYACHIHSCSEALQTLLIYSSMNLNEGNAAEPSCPRSSGGISRSICQLIKNTHPFQFSGFILNVISLSLLNL